MKMNNNQLPAKLAAVLLLVSLLLQGCSGSAVKVSATDELEICIDAHYYPMMKSVFSDYTELYPNVKITYEIVTRDNSYFAPLIDEDYKQTTLRHLQTEIMSGNGPDLFILDSGYNGECFFKDLYKAMSGGVFCDLLPLFQEAGISEEDFIEPVFDTGKIDGKQYIAPLEYQVYNMLTIEASNQNMGAHQINDTADMLAGIRAAMEIPGASVPPSKDLTKDFGYFINPYYYARNPLIDYDANTVQIDTPLTRNVLETGKLATDKLNQYKSFSQPEYSLTSWFDYMQSNRNITFCPYFLASLLNSTSAIFFGRIMEVEPIPSEDGGVCAVISSFAGIRANSGNKQNAFNMIKLLLSEKYQIKKSDYHYVYPCEGYPVRKGVLEQRIHDLVPGGESFFCPIGSQETVVLPDETRHDFISIESQITSARLPTPYEVNNILAQYYAGGLDLDTAIQRMQEYWEISLSE